MSRFAGGAGLAYSEVSRELLIELQIESEYETLIPKPYRIANAKVEELFERAIQLTVKLDTQPSDTVGLVEFMRYFDECGKQIETLIEEIDYAYQCFVLMKDYDIAVDDAEKENYMGMHFLTTNKTALTPPSSPQTARTPFSAARKSFSPASRTNRSS